MILKKLLGMNYDDYFSQTIRIWFQWRLYLNIHCISTYKTTYVYSKGSQKLFLARGIGLKYRKQRGFEVCIVMINVILIQYYVYSKPHCKGPVTWTI